jgi:PPOX class probable F420-dependent enzyme
MKMDQLEMRWRVGGSRVARLGTVGPHGLPHLMPCVFALAGNAIYTPIDHKPKRTRRLQRLKNIEANPIATVLVDRYSEDWDECWWVLLRGHARILESGDEFERARALLIARYAQYSDPAQIHPIIAIAIDDWVGWQGKDVKTTQDKSQFPPPKPETEKRFLGFIPHDATEEELAEIVEQIKAKAKEITDP